MKTPIILLLLTISLVSFSCKSEKNIVFQISGNLMDYENERIVLQIKEANTYKTVLTAENIKANFYIKSSKKLNEGLYYLQVGTDSIRIPLFVDNTDTVVYLDNLDLSKTRVDSDSKMQLTYYNFLKGSKLTKNLFAYRKRFVIENNTNILGVIALKDMLGKTKWRLEETQALFEQLAPSIQTGELGKEIYQYIQKGFENIIEETTNEEERKKTSNSLKNIKKEIETTTIPVNEELPIPKTIITEYAPFFYGNGLDGTEMSAKAVFSKNKLTLIDFWASWCRPCRAQNPDLVRLYNKYHSKGFEILSVAEDKDDANWKNAITQDNMTWKHINDDFKRIATIYHVKTIPHAILVNKHGGIITKKVSSGELERLLINEFGY